MKFLIIFKLKFRNWIKIVLINQELLLIKTLTANTLKRINKFKIISLQKFKCFN